jgi:regulator of extracellular matrix RemA (YlzA/DUF370 family)
LLVAIGAVIIVTESDSEDQNVQRRLRLMVVDVGFKNYVPARRVVAVLNADQESAPVRRFIHAARDAGRLADATFGRRTRSAILMDDGTVMLSALASETLMRRLAGGGQALRQFSEQMLSKLNRNFEEIDAWLTTLNSYLTEGEQQDAPDRSAYRLLAAGNPHSGSAAGQAHSYNSEGGAVGERP